MKTRSQLSFRAAERKWKEQVAKRGYCCSRHLCSKGRRQGSRLEAVGGQSPDLIDKLGVTGSSPVPPTNKGPHGRAFCLLG
jgi:hypothetical protein